MKILDLETERQLTPCRRNLFAFISLFIIVFTIYSNTFDCSWHFDDLGAIRDNVPIQLKKMDWQNIKQTFFASPTKSGKLYRPVSCLSIALNYYVGQSNVFGYHLVNTAIHVLASVFLFLFIYHTLNLPLLRPKYGSSAYFIALFSAAFWAINPVQVESVTYIVQRMTSLAGMFYIMAMYFYVKGRTSKKRSSRMLHYAACGISSLLAFGSKENAAMLPFSLLLFDLFLIQGLKKKNIKRNLYIFIILIAIPFALVLILRGTSVLSMDGIKAVYESKRPYGPLQQLLTEPRVILFYISLLFYPMPHRLSITHDVIIPKSLINPPSTIISILVVLMILGACLYKSRQRPFICYCILFFFMNHAIEASFLGLELIFEHRNYLPSMLLFASVAILFVKALEHYSDKRMMQGILWGFIILVMVGFGNSTFLRNYDWKTEWTLWTDAEKKAPELIRPHLNLGVYYLDHKNLEKALSEFTLAQSSRINSNITDGPSALYNIGLVHQRMRNWDQALEYYHKSAEIYPSNSDIHNNMGLIYYHQDEREKAEHHFMEALRFGKDQKQPYKNIALLYLKEGRIDEALGYLDLALTKWPHDGGILGATGYAYRLRGAFGRACVLIEKAIQSRVYDPKMHLYRAEIYFRQKMEDYAKREIQRFIQTEMGGDLKGYIKGTTKEQEIEVIQPYKKAVMQHLALAYGSGADYMQQKAQYLSEKLPKE